VKKKVAVGLLALASLVISIPLVALGGGAGGQINYGEATAGNPADFSSESWALLGSIPISNASSAPTLIRFTGAAYAQDFGQGGVFKGEKYAAMKLKVVVDGERLEDPVTFADNRGVIGSEQPKAIVSSAEWGTLNAGSQVAQIYVKSLNQHDVVGFKDWHLSVIYGQVP
jgi:hypothetical protein